MLAVPGMSDTADGKHHEESKRGGDLRDNRCSNYLSCDGEDVSPKPSGRVSGEGMAKLVEDGRLAPLEGPHQVLEHG